VYETKPVMGIHLQASGYDAFSYRLLVWSEPKAAFFQEASQVLGLYKQPATFKITLFQSDAAVDTYVPLFIGPISRPTASL
jgi:hypothetical protein